MTDHSRERAGDDAVGGAASAENPSGKKEVRSQKSKKKNASDSDEFSFAKPFKSTRERTNFGLPNALNIIRHIEQSKEKNTGARRTTTNENHPSLPTEMEGDVD